MAALRRVINCARSPGAIGPYSQAIVVDKTVYVSGQIGLIPETMEFVAADVESQTEQVMKNLGHLLEAAGSSLNKVVKTTVLLHDIKDYAKVNAIYGKYFTPPYPARAAFQAAGLPKGAMVEIEAIAISGDVKDE